MENGVSDRYSHLAGLSEEEIKIVMCLADFVTDRIGEAKEKGETSAEFLHGLLAGGKSFAEDPSGQEGGRRRSGRIDRHNRQEEFYPAGNIRVQSHNGSAPLGR